MESSVARELYAYILEESTKSKGELSVYVERISLEFRRLTINKSIFFVE